MSSLLSQGFPYQTVLAINQHFARAAAAVSETARPTLDELHGDAASRATGLPDNPAAEMSVAAQVEELRELGPICNGPPRYPGLRDFTDDVLIRIVGDPRGEMLILPSDDVDVIVAEAAA